MYAGAVNGKSVPVARYDKSNPYDVSEIKLTNEKYTVPITNSSVLSHPYNNYPGIGYDYTTTVDLQAWDWGRPGYCRQQLYALGFTAADLTP